MLHQKLEQALEELLEPSAGEDAGDEFELLGGGLDCGLDPHFGGALQGIRI